MTHARNPRWFRPALGLVICGAGVAAAQTTGRPKPKPAPPAEVRRLDARLTELRDGFLRDATELVRDYEQVGLHDRARVLLEALGRLDPANEAVKRQLADIAAKALDEQQFDLEIDPEKAWQPIGTVARGQTVRVKVAGDYRFRIAAGECGPEGPPRANPAEDMIGTLPLGAVIGVVGLSTGEANAKPPQPFLVGAAYEQPAERDGILYLRVNLPPKTQCTGSLKALVSGVTKPK